MYIERQVLADKKLNILGSAIYQKNKGYKSPILTTQLLIINC